jgi:hypothetical protein
MRTVWRHPYRRHHLLQQTQQQQQQLGISQVLLPSSRSLLLLEVRSLMALCSRI